MSSGAFPSLPLHIRMLPSFLNKPSCCFRFSKFFSCFIGSCSLRIHWLLASLISSTVRVGFVFCSSLLRVLAAFKSLINFRLRAVPLNSFVALLDCLQSIASVNLMVLICVGGSSFQLFLQSSGLYVFSFWARAFTPLHLSLFYTSFCRSCNI